MSNATTKLEDILQENEELIEKQEYYDAIDNLLESLDDYQNNTDILLKLAVAYYCLESAGSALNYINKAIKVNINLHEAYYLKAKVFFKIKEDKLKAKTSIMRALEIQKDKLEYLALAAEIFYFNGDLPQAIQYADKALELDPQSPAANLVKGLCMMDSQTPEKAESHLKTSLNIKPDSLTHCYEPSVLYLELAKTKKGLTLIKEAYAKNNNKALKFLLKYSYFFNNLFIKPIYYLDNIKLNKKQLLIAGIVLLISILLMLLSETLAIVGISIFKYISIAVFLIFIPYQLIVYPLTYAYFELGFSRKAVS